MRNVNRKKKWVAGNLFSGIETNAGLVLAGVLLTSTLSAQEKPNLLIIHTDEHNFRTLGCYRKTLEPSQASLWGDGNVVETPNIDRIADEGILCTSFYANSPVCTPSRAALVTGLYPQNAPSSQNDIPIFDTVESFAMPIEQSGYATGYAGKWHLDGAGKPEWSPVRKFGFDDNKYMFNRGHWKKLDEDANGPYVAGTDKNGNINYNLDGADETTFTTDFLVTRTINFINAHKAEPFCFMVSIPDPHGPNTVRAPYDTMYGGLTFTKPPTASKSAEGLPSWGQKQSSVIGSGGMAKYYGMVKCIDDNVGRILSFLEQEGLLEKTIVIFMSDHGDMLGEHKRDDKGVPYEASAKVPFLIRYPAALKQGVVVNKAISNVDFKPTILSILGISTTHEMQGNDVSSLFLKGEQTGQIDDIVFFRGTGSKATENWVGAVTDRYKIVYSIDSDPWLFDLQLDPDELINYYNVPGYEDVVAEMTSKLKEYGEKYNDPWLDNVKIKAEVEVNSMLTSTEDITFKKKYIAYPNPAIGNEICIEGLIKVSHVEVFDLMGNKVIDTYTSKKVDVNVLLKGMYVIKIDGKGIIKFSKN